MYCIFQRLINKIKSQIIAGYLKYVESTLMQFISFKIVKNKISPDYKHNTVCMNSVETDWRLGLVVLFMEKNIYFS